MVLPSITALPVLEDSLKLQGLVGYRILTMHIIKQNIVYLTRKSLAVMNSRQFIYQEEYFFFNQKICFSLLNSIWLKKMGKMVDLILFAFYSSFLEGQVLPLNEGESFWFPCLVSLSAVLPAGQRQQSLRQSSPLAD